jgi:hypothetical protein
MEKKAILIFLFFLTVLCLKNFATEQAPDFLIYKGDTLSISIFPLEQLYDSHALLNSFLGKDKLSQCTSCWRGYQAQWTINDNQLYLTEIYPNCPSEKLNKKVNLRKVFGAKYSNGLVKADWFNGTVYATKGKPIFVEAAGLPPWFYEAELEFDFKNGVLLQIRIFDNSKTHKSNFTHDRETLNKFLYSNINWTILPSLEKSIEVDVQFTTDRNGKIDSVAVISGHAMTILDEEAIRVVKAIPEWDVYYRIGMFKQIEWPISIIFSDENRRKYIK